MATQLFLEKTVGIGERIQQGGRQGIFSPGGTRVRDFKPGTLREFLDGLPKAQMLKLHQEADSAAVGAAAETVVKLLGLADGKRGSFFVMERAAGFKIPASLGQGNPRIDQLNDVGTGE